MIPKVISIQQVNIFNSQSFTVLLPVGTSEESAVHARPIITVFWYHLSIINFVVSLSQTGF